MRHPSARPESLGRAFTVRDALATGLTRDRLRAGDLVHPFVGARATVAPADVAGLAVALAPLMRVDQYFSHLTAAELHGMRMPEGRRAPQLHVTGRGANRAMRRPGVIGHKTELAVRVLELGEGVRASNPIDAWCECATLLPVDDLIVMGDGLIRRKSSLATVDQLARAVVRRSGRPGAARLGVALPQLRSSTDSARETTLRLLVVRAGLPEPEVNGVLVDANGWQIAHGDLVWPKFRVVLEYDGRQHAEDATQFAIDIRRLNEIAEARYRVIRVDATLLGQPGPLLAQLRRALHDGGWRG